MTKTKTKMKKILFFSVFILFVCCSLSANAAEKTTMAKQGKTVEELVPKGWVGIRSEKADFDKDGIADLVVIATPDYRENILVREDDGYETNCNKPIITFYRGNANGVYTLWKQNDNVIPAEDEFVSVDYGMTVNAKAVVTFSWSLFYSAGSSSNDSMKVVFRFQNDDFYLIGRDEESQSRMSGEVVQVSYNYLTNKKQTITSNCFDDKVKPKEHWDAIPKEPLVRFENFQ